MNPLSPPTPLSPELLQQVRQRVDRFDAGWRAGSPPPLETLLAEVPAEARLELFRQLLRLEMDHRRASQPLTAGEARQRFAGLGPWVLDALALLGLDEDATLTLEVVAGPQAGRSFPLHGHSGFFVGRGPAGVHLALEGDTGMSKVHFLVEYNPPRARLSDLRSKNGTFLNGQRVEQAELRDGDDIRAGFSTLRVRLPQDHRTVTVPGEAAEPWPVTTPATPRTLAISGYHLQEELGRGGMGVVYRARRLSDDAVVAVKMVLPAVAPRPETLDRFQREVTILRRLSHAHIVSFLDAGEASGVLYFVMEYVEGTNAGRVVKEQGPLAAERVVRLGCQLLEALAHAHLQEFVHRDIKPGNVLLTLQGGREVLKLADFGLGRAYHESALSGLTMNGDLGGTPGYMPPEQVLDFHSARPAADQYATAATLYYLQTGQQVYEAEGNALDQMKRLLHTEPRPLRQPPAGPALPGKLGEVLRRGLAREPRQRFPDVLALREALRQAL